MGIFDKLTGTRRPEDGVEAQPADAVRDALLAVGSGEVPFLVERTDDGRAELVARWRVDEPTWATQFERQDVSRLVEIQMRLDEDEHEVRAVERAFTVTWTAGVAELSVEKEASRGHQRTISFRKTGGETTWSFDSDELLNPLRDATTSRGWTWSTVVFGKL